MKERIADVAGVYYQELGTTDAMRKLIVKNSGPLLGSIDTHGGNLYEAIRAHSNEKFNELISTS